MGKILVTDTYIDFSQLEEISQFITICLHDSKKIIVKNHSAPNDTLKKYDFCLDDDFKLYDAEIIEIFKQRQIDNNTTFDYYNGTYYQI